MPKVGLYNMNGEQIGDVELSDAIFAVDVNEVVIHEAVVAHLANKRQGTQSTLTRKEVRGGGRKPWRQKGTGRARQGSIRSPQWKGGGVVFAPKPRDYSINMNKKAKKVAFFSALSSKVLNNEIFVVDDIALSQGKTKEMSEVLKKFNIKKALVVLDDRNENVERATRNIPGAKTTQFDNISTYDVIRYDAFIISQEAAKKLEGVYVK